jgi:hypothetical protein
VHPTVEIAHPPGCAESQSYQCMAGRVKEGAGNARGRFSCLTNSANFAITYLLQDGRRFRRFLQQNGQRKPLRFRGDLPPP